MIDRRSARDDHRRRRRWLGASLVVLATAAGHVARAAPVLPTGGVVRAGSASISSPGAGSLTVTQSSSRAIVDWGSFSIGSGATVRFDNGSGATLNRVTGGSVSSVDGLLSASGGVYLLNPNGVIVGRSGVVDVGGSFVASTLELSNSAFLKSGDLTFTGGSTAAVVNLGKVGALGGDIVMIASTVRNAGSITAANGDVGLLAGTQVLVRDQALDGGRFAVKLGGAGTSVTNTGAIAAATAELRADGGDVYALAGDTAGVIRATGVGTQGGRVFLTAGDAGSVALGGTIAARGANGAGGAIETSAGKVTIGAAHIDAGPGGFWLLDPNDLTIDQTAAHTIASTLDAGTSVTQQTTASGTGGNGDIFVAPNVNLTWTTNAALTLSAYRNIDIGAGTKFVSSGVGGVNLYADNAATGFGMVNFGTGASIYTFNTVNIYSHPARGSYANATNYAPFITGPGALSDYMLVDNATDLQNVQTNLSATYALNADIDASATAGLNGGKGFAPIGADPATPFVGAFEGQGHTISNLTIDRSTDGVGLFGIVGQGGRIDDVVLSSVSVTGRFYVGALVGDNFGTVTDVHVSGKVDGAGGVGGLIGVSEGSTLVGGVSSTATVTGAFDDVGGIVGADFGILSVATGFGAVNGRNNVGGLIGLAAGSIDNGVASGATSGTDAVGGLVGENYGFAKGLQCGGLIFNSYATGMITGSSAVGGIVGSNSGGYVFDVYSSAGVIADDSKGGVAGTNEDLNHTGPNIVNAYYDSLTTGTSTSFGTPISAATGLSPYAAASYTGFDFGSSGAWVIFEGQTRPMLRSEASSTITNAHQLQLVDLNRAGSYTLANNIDLSVTGNPNDVWNTATQFVPIAAGPTNTNPFAGSFDGQGHTLSHLTIAANYAGSGLFGVVGPTGRVSNLNLTQADENGGYYAGLFVGDNYGSVSNVSALGSIRGIGGVGGLVGVGEMGSSVTRATSFVVVDALDQDAGGLLGVNLGSVSFSRAVASVTGPDVVGGLIGFNGGVVSQSYASGAVLAIVDNPGQGIIAGGLVGQNYFSGVISDTYATGSVSGQNTVGGLIGYDAGTATRSYATGVLTGSPAGDQSAIGGVLGAQYGGANFAGDHPSDLVWDVATTGATFPVGFISDNTNTKPFTGVGGSTGLNPTQASSYPGFDFTNVWTIMRNRSLPTLLALPPGQ